MAGAFLPRLLIVCHVRRYGRARGGERDLFGSSYCVENTVNRGMFQVCLPLCQNGKMKDCFNCVFFPRAVAPEGGFLSDMMRLMVP